jgi:hypothetical protein
MSLKQAAGSKLFQRIRSLEMHAWYLTNRVLFIRAI